MKTAFRIILAILLTAGLTWLLMITGMPLGLVNILAFFVGSGVALVMFDWVFEGHFND